MLPCSFVLAMTVLPWLAGLAQSTAERAARMDSLMAVWSDTTQQDTARVSAIGSLIALRYLYIDPDSGLHYADRMMVVAKRSGSERHIGLAWSSQANLFNSKGDLDTALVLYRKARDLFVLANDAHNTMGVYNNIGNVLGNMGRISEAIRSYTDGLRLAEGSGDSAVMARIHGNIGVMHLRRRDNKAAMESFNKRLVIAEHLHLKGLLCEVLNNMGLVHQEEGRLDEAESTLIRARTIAAEIGFRPLVGVCLQNLGLVYRDRGELERALTTLDSSRAVAEELKDIGTLSSTLYEVSDVQRRMGRRADAIRTGQEALRLAQEGGFAENVAGSARVLYLAYKENDEAERALAMHELYVTTMDSLKSDENKQAILEQEFQFTYDKKEAILKAEQDARDANARAAVQRSRSQRNLFIGGFAVALILAGAGLWQWRNSRRHADQLTRKNAEIVRAQEQLMISERERESEQVRTRIARDMHDEIGSDLTKIGLLAARANAGGLSPIEEITALATRVRDSLHDIVWAVDPRHDNASSLVSHAEQFAHRMLDGGTSEYVLRFDLHGTDRPVDPARKRNLFLILKEALNNAVKYSNAPRVEVALQIDDRSFDLRVQDDGTGFDPVASERDGNGLRNMRTRAGLLGAELEIAAAPGRGCRVRVHGQLA